MPSWINPGAVIASPFLAGSARRNRIPVTRRMQTVGQNGRAAVTPSVFGIQGIVTNGSGGQITREAEFQMQGKIITVATRTRLYGVALDGQQQIYEPDRIAWRGDTYQVVHLIDATDIGPGYTVAVCNSIDPVDLGPQP